MVGPDLDAGGFLDEGDEVQHRHRIERAVGEQRALAVDIVAELQRVPQVDDELLSVSAMVGSNSYVASHSAATRGQAPRARRISPAAGSTTSGRASLPLAVRGMASVQRWMQPGHHVVGHDPPAVSEQIALVESGERRDGDMHDLAELVVVDPESDRVADDPAAADQVLDLVGAEAEAAGLDHRVVARDEPEVAVRVDADRVAALDHRLVADQRRELGTGADLSRA